MMRKAAAPLAIAIVCAISVPQPARAQPSFPLASRFASDFRYLANNGEADAEDFLTAPLHIGEALRSPKFYYTVLGAGAALGVAFSLDQTIRARIDHMSPSDATLLEDVGLYSISGATGLLYLYGFAADDQRARDYTLTGGESAAAASLVTLALKAGFGRTRPRQRHGAFRFFDHGESFVSGEATPAFAMAAAVSEYADNRWYVAIPAYSLALTDGLGRMGHDAHWFSDVVGAAIVGIGMTEILIRLHQNHAANPSRFRLFPVVSREGAGAGVQMSFH